ncbi:hypothetical protein CARUB_v10013956mg [Capsella rubella]|uniref:DUF506 domain-containing protein n=1 Tax=Capsella rubella TaxID=81985 RepID=R0G5I3_9BRAS|nr:uncharacterized protein LOC17893277 [Capsella rubella]EOA30812.1 hypothetical protein CARUB_v10013956mg [Capsella rubella]
MPFTMKIQPIDIDSSSPAVVVARAESGSNNNKPVLKSRLKRLFDRPFTNVLRNNATTTTEKPFVVTGGEVQIYGGGAVTEFEPSSVCLAKMVQNFIEENNEKQAKCGRNRCNCFNGNNDSSSDDESDLFGGSIDGCDASDHLKSLVPCTTVAERNLLADAAKIVDKNKSVKRKDDMKKIVNEGLLSLNYDSSICKSKWDKSPSFPAGEYEYIDVIIGEERLIIDVDFRSEFDIARQTSGYKALLQSLPFIFVGKSDRLSQIVFLISEAAKQSLKKKGMHFPPWRKAEYMRSKWLSSYTRASAVNADKQPETEVAAAVTAELVDCVESELVFEEKCLSPRVNINSSSSSSPNNAGDDDVAVEREVKAVTGLASLFKEKP